MTYGLVGLLVFYVTSNDISVIYLTAQMCRRMEEVVQPKKKDNHIIHLFWPFKNISTIKIVLI